MYSGVSGGFSFRAAQFGDEGAFPLAPHVGIFGILGDGARGAKHGGAQRREDQCTNTVMARHSDISLQNHQSSAIDMVLDHLARGEKGPAKGRLSVGSRPRLPSSLALSNAHISKRGLAFDGLGLNAVRPSTALRRVVQPATWVTLLTDDMGNTFLVLFSSAVFVFVVGSVGMWATLLHRCPHVHRPAAWACADGRCHKR